MNVIPLRCLCINVVKRIIYINSKEIFLLKSPIKIRIF
jgi:hypothetical protein